MLELKDLLANNTPSNSLLRMAASSPTMHANSLLALLQNQDRMRNQGLLEHIRQAAENRRAYQNHLDRINLAHYIQEQMGKRQQDQFGHDTAMKQYAQEQMNKRADQHRLDVIGNKKVPQSNILLSAYAQNKKRDYGSPLSREEAAKQANADILWTKTVGRSSRRAYEASKKAHEQMGVVRRLITLEYPRYGKGFGTLKKWEDYLFKTHPKEYKAYVALKAILPGLASEYNIGSYGAQTEGEAKTARDVFNFDTFLGLPMETQLNKLNQLDNSLITTMHQLKPQQYHLFTKLPELHDLMHPDTQRLIANRNRAAAQGLPQEHLNMKDLGISYD